MKFLAAMLLFLLPTQAFAQAPVFDPTSYVPAISYYFSARADWRSSQPWFDHGYVEKNPRFTLSGEPNSKPISYSQGMFKIENDTAIFLGIGMGHNLASGLILKNHPRWDLVERIGFSLGLSWYISSQHVEQTHRNNHHPAW